ncbi:MAG: hypothetical protein V1929_09405 [bacterium]
MPNETNPFEKLLVDLAHADVRFLTIGGVACALCGFVRTTEDIDILVARDDRNVETMLRTLQSFGEGHARELSLSDFADEEGSVRIVEDFPLDIFVRLRGFTYEKLLPYKAWHEVSGSRIPYLNPHGLILLKQESNREKDRIDVSALRGLLDHTEPRIDAKKC